MTFPAADLTLRRSEPADLDALIVLAAEYCAADGHDFDDRRVRSGLSPLLDNDRYGTVWVAESSAGLAGYAVATWGWSVEIGGAEAVLDELYVRSRGQGTGTALLTSIVDDCRRHGMRRVFLETERRNDAARRLYARHGFVEDDSIWMSLDLAVGDAG
jgi:GNAT superfamily N-acetyltransferase